MSTAYKCILFLLICFSVKAENAHSLKLENKSFNEVYSSNVPVSGRVIAGLMLKTNHLGEFNINLPVIDGDSICFRVQSQDGTYRSINQYKVVDKNTTGIISPDYPTQYNELLASFSSSELAVLAFEGNCSDKKITNVLIASRGALDVKQDVIILVSSGRSDVFFTTKSINGRKKTTKCKRIEQGKRTAYDTLCKVGFESFIVGENDVSILRRKSGRMLPPVKFKILYTNS